MKRRFFAWSFLSVLLALGCAEGNNSESQPSGQAGCGNGVLEPGEDCEGNQWAAGKNVCPSGTTGSPVCDPQTCKAVTTGHCFVPISTCGNNLLDAGEECDIINGSAQWILGKGVCPVGMNGAPQCVQCHEVTDNYCSVNVETCPSSCTNGCNADGTCKAPECPSSCTNGCNADGTCKPEGNDCAALGYEACDTPNAEKCLDDTTHAVCIEGCWMTETCPAAKQQKCDVGSGKCVADCVAHGYEACSEENAQKCVDGKNYAICVDGCWMTDACPGNQTCDAEHKACVFDCAAAGYQACSAQEEGTAKCADENTLEVCTSGCWMPTDCSSSGESCDAEAKQCVADCASHGLEKCDVPENTEKCLDDNTLAICVDGCWMTDICSDYGKTCKASANSAACEASQELGCRDNILVTEEKGKIVEFDCTSVNGICDPATKECQNAQSISCDGTVLTVKDNDKSYAYDCALDGKGCHKEVGCYNDYCEGKSRMRCTDGVCSVLETCDAECIEQMGYKNVAETVCTCSEAQADATRCLDSGTMVMCIEGQWVEEICGAGMSCQDGECKEASLCGNGYLNAGEDCDTAQFKEYGISCNKYDKYSAFTGAPACTDQCKVSMAGCQVKPESEILSWKFTSLEAIKNYTKGDTCSIYGGFDSKYSLQDGKNAWVLGPWSKASTPDFDDRYLEFDVADVKEYDSLSISFYAKRKDNGPRKLKLRFKASGRTEYSEVISLPTKWNASPYQIKVTHDFIKSASGKLEIRFRAYESVETNGSISISDVVVKGAKK